MATCSALLYNAENEALKPTSKGTSSACAGCITEVCNFGVLYGLESAASVGACHEAKNSAVHFRTPAVIQIEEHDAHSDCR